MLLFKLILFLFLQYWSLNSGILALEPRLYPDTCFLIPPNIFYLLEVLLVLIQTVSAV
jgi:hypothetical protein